MPEADPARPHIVIIGAGFAGLTAAAALKNAAVDITVIDRRNHHLFQPLLYQVATAGLPGTEIAWPIRAVLRRQRNAAILMAEVTGIDTAARQVHCDDHAPVAYDKLIVATGVGHAYFGNDHWQPHAPGLKNLTDALSLRRRILTAFERAEAATDVNEQQRQLTFAVIGAGPTGVEMAGALAELAYRTLTAEFRHINPDSARVMLLEAGPRILPAFSAASSGYARKALRRLGVEVHTDCPVADCNDHGIGVGDNHIPAATIIWAAGVQAPAIGQWLNAATDRAGRVQVQPDFRVPQQDNIFVIGDSAAVTDANGTAVPGIAPAAKQQGRHVARQILADLDLADAPGPFRYRHLGNLATIGRHAAIVDLGRIRFTGRTAWWLWGITHIYFLIGVRAPLMVALEWLWSYITSGKGARVIAEPERNPQ